MNQPHMLMKTSPVVSVTTAAREKGCSRQAIYDAANRGALNVVDTGSAFVVVRDELFEQYTPRKPQTKES